MHGCISDLRHTSWHISRDYGMWWLANTVILFLASPICIRQTARAQAAARWHCGTDRAGSEPGLDSCQVCSHRWVRSQGPFRVGVISSRVFFNTLKNFLSQLPVETDGICRKAQGTWGLQVATTLWPYGYHWSNTDRDTPTTLIHRSLKTGPCQFWLNALRRQSWSYSMLATCQDTHSNTVL